MGGIGVGWGEVGRVCQVLHKFSSQGVFWFVISFFLSDPSIPRGIPGENVSQLRSPRRFFSKWFQREHGGGIGERMDE